ncbi:uncharacterized protein LOC110456860 isoform X2 [Mizuhopecten yessoensis]|nr:uncharacterized protein LOC110456860 isoform X2 [Mizuhopecten yessoensis]XP_021363559.1 uncharacterized protein LOC110456860 isoform X2 [Mizuhopecten yessoensis]
MLRWYREKLARNFNLPENTFIGRHVKKLLEKNNAVLEMEAVRLCDIQPDHQVLEVGFGPGIGIQAACHLIEDGNGTVQGIDISSLMLETATERNGKFLQTGKLILHLQDVADSTFDSNTFDRVFHCNCYYFWKDSLQAAKELYRVMKPRSIMVTTLDHDAIINAQKKNLLQYGKPDPEEYIHVLETVGFRDVRMEHLNHERSGRKYQAIFAYIGDKKEDKYIDEANKGRLSVT